MVYMVYMLEMVYMAYNYCVAGGRWVGGPVGPLVFHLCIGGLPVVALALPPVVAPVVAPVFHLCIGGPQVVALVVAPVVTPVFHLPYIECTIFL